MHISIILNESMQWYWRLVGAKGVCYAEGAQVFPHYADAYVAAVESCTAMQHATVEDNERAELIDFKVMTGSEVLSDPPSDSIFQSLVKALNQTGLHGALSVLNQTVPHRFTGIYLIDKDRMLRNLTLFDKHGEPCPEELRTVPLSASFCQFAVRTGGFHTSNSGKDIRLNGHWAKGMYNAYAGVPILAEDGTALATLCHFDHHPCNLDYEGLDLLRLAARLFKREVRPSGSNCGQAVK